MLQIVELRVHHPVICTQGKVIPDLDHVVVHESATVCTSTSPAIAKAARCCTLSVGRLRQADHIGALAANVWSDTDTAIATVQRVSVCLDLYLRPRRAVAFLAGRAGSSCLAGALVAALRTDAF